MREWNHDRSLAEGLSDAILKGSVMALDDLPQGDQLVLVGPASLIREIASHGGDVSHYAPANVVQALKTKFAKP